MVAQRADELFYDGPDGEALASADERDLTIAFKAGSEDAYSVIYGRYRLRVESICRRMLGNRDDAQEATQEAFLRVFQALHSFNGRYQLGAWITRIATNVCLDALRARTRRPADPAPIDELELGAHEVETDSDPEFFVIRRAESRRVRKVLEGLPPLHRAAIVLRDFEGMSYDEVASVLDLSPCQVKALIHRARQGFKRSWASQVASLLLPARFLPKVKELDHGLKEQTPSLFSHASQVVASCNMTVQSCGAFMAERATNFVATAAMVGVVTTSVVSASAGPPPTQEPSSSETVASASFQPNDEGRDRGGRAEREKDGAPLVPVPTPSATPTTPPPVTEEEPPTPGDDGGAVTPTPEPTPTVAPPAEPTGFTFAGGYTGAAPSKECSGCLRDSRLIRESGRSEADGAIYFSQSLEGNIDVNGTPTYGLALDHEADRAGTHQMSFTLWSSEGSFPYSATGALVSWGETAWGGRTYRYEGSFKRLGGPSGEAPTETTGSYVVEMTFSVTQQRFVSSVLTLNPDL